MSGRRPLSAHARRHVGQSRREADTAGWHPGRGECVSRAESAVVELALRFGPPVSSAGGSAAARSPRAGAA
eukprot:5652094-Alexandrium_andersonii.AAC.1